MVNLHHFSIGAMPSQPLTRELLDEAIEAIQNDRRVDPCKLGQHLVTPQTKRRGFGFCHNCASPVGDWPVNPYSDWEGAMQALREAS